MSQSCYTATSNGAAGFRKLKDENQSRRSREKRHGKLYLLTYARKFFHLVSNEIHAVVSAYLIPSPLHYFIDLLFDNSDFFLILIQQIYGGTIIIRSY